MENKESNAQEHKQVPKPAKLSSIIAKTSLCGLAIGLALSLFATLVFDVPWWWALICTILVVIFFTVGYVLVYMADKACQ